MGSRVSCLTRGRPVQGPPPSSRLSPGGRGWDGAPAPSPSGFGVAFPGYPGIIFSQDCNSLDFWLIMAVDKTDLPLVMLPGKKLMTGKLAGRYQTTT